MTDDIVKQLRDSACGNNCRCPYCNRNKDAANEIERLRTELARVELDRDILVQHVQRNSQGGR